MKLIFLQIIFIYLFSNSLASIGDQSPYYQRCIDKYIRANCTEDGYSFMENDERPFYLNLLQWSCKDECRYECMWKTMKAFHDRNWKTPQFHGKWPFIRFFGLQEPASVLFSLLNFYAHVKMLKKFRNEVASDSPLFWLWHAYFLVSANAWIWSTVFHARDFDLTEFMDYASAYSIVLMSCYCMFMRILRRLPRFLLITITTFFVAFYANHVAYLSMGKFDYGYNMEINIITGTLTAIFWFAWCVYNRIRQPYVWKCAIFVALTGIVMLLEIIDRPPIFWIFDFHSLWHLSTAPLICLFYSFIIDDCNYLRKTEGFHQKLHKPIKKKH